MCCSVLQCVAVCCSVLQCVVLYSFAVCCNVLQRVAVLCIVLQFVLCAARCLEPCVHAHKWYVCNGRNEYEWHDAFIRVT